jgi:hypothetical protein
MSASTIKPTYGKKGTLSEDMQKKVRAIETLIENSNKSSLKPTQEPIDTMDIKGTDTYITLNDGSRKKLSELLDEKICPLEDLSKYFMSKANSIADPMPLKIKALIKDLKKIFPDIH